MIASALPEIFIVLAALSVLIADISFSLSFAALSDVALLGLFAALTAVGLLFGNSAELLGGRFAIDDSVLWFKLIFLLAALFTVILSRESFRARDEEASLTQGGEYLVLVLFSLLGMLLLVSSRDLVTIYVNLELSTIPLILLSAWSKHTVSSEAALKYVVLGAVSSALLLFGMGVLYGLTGVVDIGLVAAALPARPVAVVALGFLGAGIGFKLTLFPFHMWAPDVYEGAPTPITAFLSVASKSVGVALTIFLFSRLVGSSLAEWGFVMAVLAAITMSVGNLAAISQRNIKRFMAYSSISQAGYLLMGFLGDGSSGFPEVIYYLVGYLVTNFAVFAVIIHLEQAAGSKEISDYAGLSERSPFLAVVMMVALFSLAGIPPLAGFTGKFFLFSVAANAHYYWLVGLAAVNSTVSLYYYLRIVRQMYIERPVDCSCVTIGSPLVRWTLVMTLLATVVVGVSPAFYEHIRKDAAPPVQLSDSGMRY